MRVLLIARSRGEWWLRLGGPGRALAEAVTEVELPLELGPGTDSLEVMREAAQFFAVKLGKPEPDLTLPADPRAPVLVLHAAALVRVLDGDDGLPGSRVLDTKGVLRNLLGHERELWNGHAERLGLTLDATVLARITAVLALLAPEDETSTRAAVRRIPDLARTPTTSGAGKSPAGPVRCTRGGTAAGWSRWYRTWSPNVTRSMSSARANRYGKHA